RGWTLLAAHARTNHVHIVVVADQSPERMMNDFKSYASRKLNGANVDPPEPRRWTRHGSTRYLFTPEEVAGAVRYVVHEQGDPLAVFELGSPLPDGAGSCGGATP